MDLVKIATACAVECERQQVGIEGLRNLLRAYEFATSRTFNSSLFSTTDSFAQVGTWVEPAVNHWGFRKHPVTFQNGGSSANHREIPRLMGNLVDAIPRLLAMQDHEPIAETIALIVREFLWIHPFADGNGRVGFLLYNYLRGSMDSPLPLPNYFKE